MTRVFTIVTMLLLLVPLAFADAGHEGEERHDDWSAGEDDGEIRKYISAVRGKRIQFKFSNQNVADQKMKVLKGASNSSEVDSRKTFFVNIGAAQVLEIRLEE